MTRSPRWLLVTVVSGQLALMTARAAEAQGPARPALDSATSRRVAENVVNRVARVRPGELVMLAGGERDLPLLEDLSIAVAKVGAYPLINYGSDRLVRRYFDEVPAALDTLGPQLRTLPLTDVFIWTDFIDPATYGGIDPARVAARQKADAPFRAALQTWKGRSIGLGNGLYPTPGTARQAGISLAALTAMYRAGLDVDYDALGRTAALVQAALAHGKDIHLTAPNGTDLQAKIGGQTPYVSDGVISDADRAGSLAQRSAYLPAGEAYVVMTPGSATGKLVMGRSWYRDKLITKLEVDVEKGKLRRLSAGSGAATLQADFDKAGAGKDQVGVLDIGLNPAIHPPAGSHIQPWSQSGILTIAIGNNQWAGGDNTGEFGLVIQLADATLVVDGHPIVDHGRLMVTASEASR